MTQHKEMFFSVNMRRANYCVRMNSECFTFIAVKRRTGNGVCLSGTPSLFVTDHPLKWTHQTVTAGSSFQKNTSASRHRHLISLSKFVRHWPWRQLYRGKTGSRTVNLKMSRVRLLAQWLLASSLRSLICFCSFLKSRIPVNVGSTHLLCTDVSNIYIIAMDRCHVIGHDTQRKWLKKARPYISVIGSAMLHTNKVIIRIHFVCPDGTVDQNSKTTISARPSLSLGRF